MMTTSGPRDGRISQQIIKAPEFTRRKNWSQHILDELRDIVLVITSEMMVVYCSSASRECLGYEPHELVNNRFTEFVHLDDVDALKRTLRASKDTMGTLRAVFRLQGKDAKFNMVEMTGHFYKNCFFGTARITPVQATRTMEEILGLKMENKALKQKLHELQEQQAKQQSLVEQRQRGEQGVNETATASAMEELATAPHVYTPGINISYDIAETLSLFTGLHYEMGERSRGISMGIEGELLNISPEPMTKIPTAVGPMGKEFVLEEPQRKSRKKKRIEVQPQQRICIGCGTTNSPEWRRGPKGPKTYCNACGIKWRKIQNPQTKEKEQEKEQQQQQQQQQE